MAEPTSSTAGAVAGWKLLGGAAGVAGLGAAASLLVVLAMRLPSTRREWVVALVSTVMSSITVGSAVVLRFGLLRYLTDAHSDLEVYLALCGLGGIVFTCGLPGWMVVRWVFNWMLRRADKDAGEVIADVRKSFHGNNG